MPRPKVSPIWEHFKEVNKDEVSCNICGKTLKNIYNCAKPHLIRAHRIFEEEDRLKWENDEYLLWKHFLRGDPFEASCKLCSTLIINAFRPDIEKHLNNYHQEEVAKIQIEITSNSELSQHFKFENLYATCKMQQSCNFQVKIYEGINVLKCHWKGHKIQHSVYEETYAGPSFHRDNYTYWSPALGYPGGYRMIQHSIEGNHAGPSSYYNNSHLLSLGNEGGQQSGQQGSRSPDKFWRPW